MDQTVSTHASVLRKKYVIPLLGVRDLANTMVCKIGI